MPSITLSSAGTSTAIPTDYIGAKTTSVNASFTSSTSSAAFSIQGTLDDPMRVASPSWFALSSATWISSTNFDTPAFLQILTPIAGVRLTSTGLSSGSVTLRVLQNAGG